MPDVVYNGKTYEVTDEGLAELNKRGVKYTSPGETQDEGPSLAAQVIENVGDSTRGVAHGATFGLADARVPFTEKSLPEHLGMAPYAEVEKRSPVLSTMGDFTGSMLVPGGAEVKGAKLLANVGRSVGRGAIESGARGLSEASQDGYSWSDMKKVLEDSALGAGVGAAATGLFSGAGKVKSWLGNQSDMATARSVGVLGKEATKLPDMGMKSVKEVADAVREISPSSVFKPKSAADRFGEIEPTLDAKYGPAVDDALRDANIDQVTPGYWGQAMQSMQNSAAGAKLGTEGERQLASGLNKNVSALAQEAAPSTLVEMRQQASRYGKAGRNKGDGSLGDTGAQEASQLQERAIRDELDNAMNVAGPDAQAGYATANKDYSQRAQLLKYLEKRKDVEGTANVLAPLAAIGGATGMGYLVGDKADQGMAGGLMGTAAAAFGTRSQMVQALEKSAGQDFLANVASSLAKRLPSEGAKVSSLVGTAGRVGAGEYDPSIDMDAEERERRAALGYGSR